MADSAPSFLERHQFLIRRLHSLSGLIPVGAFVCVHLAVNASYVDAPGTYQNLVYQIHSLNTLLPLVEWTFIFLPLIFHAVVGFWIIAGGLPNQGSYPYQRNFRYTLQRASGMLAAVFILYHVLHMHGWSHFDWWTKHVAEPLGGHQFRAYNAASTTAAALQSPWVLGFYVIGIVASVFHLSNGIWTMGITWGAWTSAQAQTRALRVCDVFGVLLLALGLAALWGPYRLGSDEARLAEVRELENQIYEQRVAAGLASPNPKKRSEPHSAGATPDLLGD